MVTTPRSLPEILRHSSADEMLKRRLVNFLHERQVPEAHALHVQSHVGTIVVSGKLKSRHDKWLCLECCRRVAGVIKLIDQLEVRPPQVSIARKAA